jgi:pimeloyl-ACP methyl ester carboxylesterase
VFVHGIYGSDQPGLDIGNFGDWPQRLQADPRFSGRWDLRLFSYRSFNLGRSRRYSIPEHAQRLRRDLADGGAAGYARVHFIAHSMGGLIVRQALVDAAAERWATRLGALVLLSSPAGGSRDAAWLGELGISESEAKAMSPGAPYLKRLQAAWDAAFKARILAAGQEPKAGRILLALGAEQKGLWAGKVVSPASVKAIGKHSRYRAFPLNHLQMARCGPGNLAVYEWVAQALNSIP